MKRRSCLFLALLLGALTLSTATANNTLDNAAWELLRGGGIALFRHANARGVGDPPGMRLDDCSTERNLDEEGRLQARRIGDAFRSRGIQVSAALTSQWCRAVDTAEIAFPGLARVEPVFNSFFDDPGRPQTQAAKRLLEGWRGPGALFVSTHQVNITALTGLVPISGEGVVLRTGDDGLVVFGRIRPQQLVGPRRAVTTPTNAGAL
jgi:phosphohistidine phosphatase SixA